MQQGLRNILILKIYVTVVLSILLQSLIIAQELTTSEKKVILIFKFAENVQWQDDNNIDTFKIGMFTDDEKFVSDLRIFETVKLKNKPISLFRFYNINELSKVHILVMTDDKNYLMDKVFDHIEGNHMLLITDGCKKQDLIMINFIYGKNNKIEFEINKANIIKEDMYINPDLLLLGGTEIDIADLYKESQKSLFEIRRQVEDLEDKYLEQQSELEDRNELLEEKTLEIDLRNKEINQQKKQLVVLNIRIIDQDQKLRQNLNVFNDLQNTLENKVKDIDKSNEILNRLNEEIASKQNKINTQEERITTYESTVDQQKTIIYLAMSSLALVLVIVIIVYKGFINKKKTAKKLEEKEAEIRMLFDIAPVPVIMTELISGKAIYINRLGLDLFKLNQKNAIQYISAKDHYVDASQRDEIIVKLKKEKRINNLEVLLKNSKGEQFYGSLSGLITKYEDKTVMFLAIKDITDIKNAVEELNRYKVHLEDLVQERSQELMESQKRFKEMAELLPETIFEMDKKGVISFMNNRGMEMFDYLQNDLNDGISIYDVISESDRSEAKQLMEKLLKGKEIQTTEFLFQKRNAYKFPGIIYLNCSDKGEGEKIRGIVVDITERKNLERKILNTMIETEEKERKRFAEDLHDGLGSLLSSLNLYVDMADNPELSEQERNKYFTSIRDIIDESINNSKEISNNLRPSTLSRFGLTGSLQSFCDKINDTKKIKISLDYSEFSIKLTSNTENALYRIVNELINNTLKYASAENILIKLENKKDTLILSYKDDGIGFNKQNAIQSGGMGLKNIYTRANSIDGTCIIKSDEGKGTEVEIKVIINNNQ